MAFGIIESEFPNPSIQCDFYSFQLICLCSQLRKHSGSVVECLTRGQRHCVVSLSKSINPSLVLIQPRKTRPFITERSLMGRKESNQTNKTKTKQPVMSESLLQIMFTSL